MLTRKKPQLTAADVKAEAWMSTNFANVPPAALAVFRRANLDRRTPQRPLKAAVQASKGITVPAATATKPKPATVTPTISAKHQMARHIVPTLKSFSGPDAARDAYAAGQVLLASMGRITGERNYPAEHFCNEHRFGLVSSLATESNPTSGGYLVDNPLSAAIVELKAKVGISRQLATVIPMGSETLEVPKEVAGFTVKYPDQGETINASDLQWGMVALRSERRAIVGFVSNELMADSVVAMADLFARRAAYALAAQEDNEFVNGDGTSAFGGEVGLKGAIGAGGIYTAATGHDTWPEIDVTDFTGVMGKLPSRFSNGGESWVCSPQFYALAMLKSVGGASQGFDENGRPLFLGKPVFLTSKAPTTAAASTIACYYGSFSEAVTIGDRVPFALGVSEHAAFGQDLTALRGSARYDINCHECGDATSAGAVVALQTAS